MNSQTIKYLSFGLLCAWFLITPRLSEKVDMNTPFDKLREVERTDLPLFQWVRLSSHDTARECNKHRLSEIKGLSNLTSDSPKLLQSSFMGLLSSECVSSDMLKPE